MNEVLKKIGEIGIIPVVVLDDAKDAEPLAKALIEGGLPCAEVTFRTAAAVADPEGSRRPRLYNRCLPVAG